MSNDNAGATAYEGYVPEDLKEYLNFGSNIVFMLMGYFLRWIGRIKDEHIPGMHLLTFTLCLPSLMVFILWSGEIKENVISILPLSAMTHFIWCLIVSGLVKYVGSNFGGIYGMAMTGNGLAYVYPVILGSERFGAAAVGPVVMWELGGNMAVAVVYHSIMAQTYAPAPKDKAPRLKRGESFAWAQLPATPDANHQRRPRASTLGLVDRVQPPAAASVAPIPSPPDNWATIVPGTVVGVHEESAKISSSSCSASTAKKHVDFAHDVIEDCEKQSNRPRSMTHPSPIVIGNGSSNGDPFEEEVLSPTSPVPLIPFGGTVSQASASSITSITSISTTPLSELSPSGKVKVLLGPVVKTPLLWGVLIGITLNVLKVPFYPLPAMALRTLTGAFPALMYFLLGASIRFNLSCDAYSTVVRVLLSRWVMCALAAGAVRFVMPVDEFTRGILTLCIAAPITTTFIMFAGQNGYKMDVVAMIKNVSDISSLVLLNVIVAFV